METNNTKLTEADKIFEKHWTKVTGKPLDEWTRHFMKYAIDAIQEALDTQTPSSVIEDRKPLSTITDEEIEEYSKSLEADDNESKHDEFIKGAKWMRSLFSQVSCNKVAEKRKPLSEITDEDATEVAKILKPNDSHTHNAEYGRGYVKRLFEGTTYTVKTCFELHGFLQGRNYELPVYFSPPSEVKPNNIDWDKVKEDAKNSVYNFTDFQLNVFDFLKNEYPSSPLEVKEKVEVSDGKIVEMAKKKMQSTSWCDPYSFEEGAKWMRSLISSPLKGKQETEDKWIKYDFSKIETRPKYYGKYFICRKDGKVHWETWNGSGWAYNENVITHWMPLPQPPIPKEDKG